MNQQQTTLIYYPRIRMKELKKTTKNSVSIFLPSIVSLLCINIFKRRLFCYWKNLLTEVSLEINRNFQEAVQKLITCSSSVKASRIKQLNLLLGVRCILQSKSSNKFNTQASHVTSVLNFHEHNCHFEGHVPLTFNSW